MPNCNINELIDKTFPNLTGSTLSQDSEDTQYFLNRAILALTNFQVDIINDLALKLLAPNEPIVQYTSIDTIDDTDPDQMQFLTSETLNSVEESGLPSHKLNLKVGFPVIVMRNLNP